jgi:cytosine deaminase
VLGLEGYGLEPGCFADMVVLQARGEIDALRLRPARLAVIRRGRVIAVTPEVRPRLFLEEETLLDLSSDVYERGTNTLNHSHRTQIKADLRR